MMCIVSPRREDQIVARCLSRAGGYVTRRGAPFLTDHTAPIPQGPENGNRL